MIKNQIQFRLNHQNFIKIIMPLFRNSHKLSGIWISAMAIFTQAHAFQTVNIDPKLSTSTKLAIQACIGLYNRNNGGSAYALMKPTDGKWLTALNMESSQEFESTPFLEKCMAEFPKCVRYSYKKQQNLLPNVLTVAAALEAIPVDEEMGHQCNNVVFDAQEVFKDKKTAYLATKYVYENFVDKTTGMAMLNPGYESNQIRKWNPRIIGDIDPSMVDFVFSKKLFVTFLVNGCMSFSNDHVLMNNITQKNPWQKPIGVYGYSESWLVFGGFVFEAHTLCSTSRNMGAIPTTQSSNLSFFSTRRAPMLNGDELKQNKAENIDYDPNKTYVAFVVGDGDNVSYMKSERANWIERRLAHCKENQNTCLPLTWSISPHLAQLAPDILKWYYDMSHKTGKDYFMLPPSGHLYSYPSSMPEELQKDFVSLTEQDAHILGTKSTVDWEWWSTWRKAERTFFPKYAKKDGAIKGIFPVNVPYMFPTFTWWKKNEYFKIITGKDNEKVVLFSPREWRGISNQGNTVTKKFFFDSDKMAREISNYPRGTITYVYMTSDGGLSLENAFIPLTTKLAPHVRLVSADAAVELALRAKGITK